VVPKCRYLPATTGELRLLQLPDPPLVCSFQITLCVPASMQKTAPEPSTT
jgi:hypothetical protein